MNITNLGPLGFSCAQSFPPLRRARKIADFVQGDPVMHILFFCVIYEIDKT